jgi:signal transduction histidine kinase
MTNTSAATGPHANEVMRSLAKYAGTVLVMAAGVQVALWLQTVLDASVVLLIAILAVAWFAGFWPSVLGSALATLAIDYYFTEPLYILSLDFAHLPRLIAFTAIAALFIGITARRRSAERALKQAHDELDLKVRERTAELEELAGRLIHAQEQERSRIGRELHDHISQMLGVLTIGLDQLRAADTTPPALGDPLERLRANAAEITDEIHGLSHRLHSSALDYLGLVPALQRLIQEFSTRLGIVIEFAHGPLPAPLPSDVALSLFRVTEESLTNIAKHSQATTAAVEVHADDEGIHLTIEDSGRGFDGGIERRHGLGFVSMRERLRIVGGTVRVDSAPSRGTTVTVWVPAMLAKASSA